MFHNTELCEKGYYRSNINRLRCDKLVLNLGQKSYLLQVVTAQ